MFPFSLCLLFLLSYPISCLACEGGLQLTILCAQTSRQQTYITCTTTGCLCCTCQPSCQYNWVEINYTHYICMYVRTTLWCFHATHTHLTMTVAPVSQCTAPVLIPFVPPLPPPLPSPPLPLLYLQLSPLQPLLQFTAISNVNGNLVLHRGQTKQG